MAINLMAPKGSEENVKLSTEIWKKLNEAKKKQSASSDQKLDTETK